MASDLLSTKLRIPPQTHHVVWRGRLVDALDDGIPSHKLTLISAPAGYGKTTLLAQWAHTSRVPIVWLSVSEEDHEVERFFRYLLAGWEQVQPGVSDSPLGLLLGSMVPNIDAVLYEFVNVADDLSGQTVFVLDDYHLIDDSSIHRALAFLLDHLPLSLHFVLACRGKPPLPLARYRARQELLEFEASDLQFSAEETADFANRAMGLTLTDAEIATLNGRLEGWIAGLQLVTLARQRPGAAESLAISGRQRFIADYLSDEVLAHLPDDLRRFLLQTSILDRLSGPLCDAVTAGEGAQAKLELLERENLFLVPLDDSREWYRYHRLFSEFLSAMLRRQHPDEFSHLHRRAGGWHLDHDLPDQAFQHAIAGHDAELVIRIFERYVFVKLWSGEIRVLNHWLDSLPAEWYSAYPVLGLARTGPLAAAGAVDACLRCLDEVEQRLLAISGEDLLRQLAMVTAIRCAIACAMGDLALAEEYAAQALRDLTDDDLSFRAEIHHSLGETYRGYARWEEARDHYLKELDLVHEPAFRIRAAHVFGALADLDLRQGRLRNAASHWRQALAAIQERENWGRLPLPVTGWVYVRVSELLYEWNELAEASDQMARGLERAELGGDVRSLIAGYLLASRLKLTETNLDAADVYLEQARPLVEQAQFPEWTSRFERMQIELWLARDRLRAIVAWADQVPRDNAFQGRPEPEVAQLALARALLVKDDAPSVERALALLDGLLRAAEGDGRMGVQIEGLALRALAHWRRDERADSMTSLERALRLAEPEGYLRLFADLGFPMARLLQEARSRAIMPEYVTTLLTVIGGGPSVRTSMQEALPEPLTTREREVLEQIAAGLTNSEIADRLSISPETVKKHTGNIYGKLTVHSRRKAIARARELALLD